MLDWYVSKPKLESAEGTRLVNQKIKMVKSDIERAIKSGSRDSKLDISSLSSSEKRWGITAIGIEIRIKLESCKSNIAISKIATIK